MERWSGWQRFNLVTHSVHWRIRPEDGGTEDVSRSRWKGRRDRWTRRRGWEKGQKEGGRTLGFKRNVPCTRSKPGRVQGSVLKLTVHSRQGPIRVQNTFRVVKPPYSIKPNLVNIGRTFIPPGQNGYPGRMCAKPQPVEKLTYKLRFFFPVVSYES